MQVTPQTDDLAGRVQHARVRQQQRLGPGGKEPLARQRGQAVLFSSHVLNEVEQICDRVAILRRGELVHLQPMSERRDGRYVRAQFGTAPDTGPDGSPLKAADGVVELEYRGPLPGLLKWLNDHPPVDVRIEPLGLGPIYKRIHGSVE